MQTGEALGQYRIVRKLGQGGMGSVWIAHDERLRRDVALKLLALDAEDPAAKRRFRREAECMTGLNHPGLVKVFDFGTHGPRTPESFPCAQTYRRNVWSRVNAIAESFCDCAPE